MAPYTSEQRSKAYAEALLLLRQEYEAFVEEAFTTRLDDGPPKLELAQKILRTCNAIHVLEAERVA
jgi:hypothetical protein